MDDIVGITASLTPELALAAYRQGLFPMADWEAGIVTWHLPDPRAIIPLDGFHLSRSLRRTLRQGRFQVTYDQDFGGVLAGCAERKPTWISPEFGKVYGQLHRQGAAHSVEVWAEGRLAGGVYGVQLGGAFMAESKFHRVTDASKVALAGLVRRLRERGFLVLEVQYLTEHLRQFGTIEISQDEYQELLTRAVALPCKFV